MRTTGRDPSRRLKLRRAGFSETACLDFDLAVLEFGESFERERNATVSVVASGKPKKIRYVQVPKYTPKELAEKFLQIDTSIIDDIEEAAAEMVDDLAEDILAGDADDWLYNPQG